MIGVRREVAVFQITLVRRYKWYEKYAAGMQGKIDVCSFFMCNSLYNCNSMQSMRFTAPPHPFCTYKWYEIYADCMRDYGLAYSNIMHISVYIRARMRTRQCLHTQDSPKLYLL